MWSQWSVPTPNPTRLWVVASGQKVPQQRRKMFSAGSFRANFHLEVTFLWQNSNSGLRNSASCSLTRCRGGLGSCWPDSGITWAVRSKPGWQCPTGWWQPHKTPHEGPATQQAVRCYFPESLDGSFTGHLQEPGVPLQPSLGHGCNSYLHLQDQGCPDTPQRWQGHKVLTVSFLLILLLHLAGFAPCLGGTIWPGLAALDVMPDLGSCFCHEPVISTNPLPHLFPAKDITWVSLPAFSPAQASLPFPSLAGQCALGWEEPLVHVRG